MVRLFLLSLLAILAGLVLAVNLSRDPGYVLIAYDSYTFETSLFALLVVLLLVLVLLRLLFSILRLLDPRRLFRSRHKATKVDYTLKP